MDEGFRVAGIPMATGLSDGSDGALLYAAVLTPRCPFVSRDEGWHVRAKERTSTRN